MRDAQLTELIRETHSANYGVYGAPKVWHDLRRRGHGAARCTVERLMRDAGLTGAARGKKIRTTTADAGHERAADLLNRDFVAARPNRCWVADFTHVAAWYGVVYVAFAVDVYARAIVGWSAATNKRTPLVLAALNTGRFKRLSILPARRDSNP
ncbi:IS3 family transposase [Plantactinospora sp. B24E8]|uniref:IS3 family transposase n=1 Tax=Plantactinospora sp. B24E8 TaxID=3153567 RepID=UPI00325D3AC7